jgi:DNA-binding NarL/FixJ family response regulator
MPGLRPKAVAKAATADSAASASDPAVVAKLLGRPAKADPLAAMTERERSVLALMAEGLSSTAIASAPS